MPVGQEQEGQVAQVVEKDEKPEETSQLDKFRNLVEIGDDGKVNDSKARKLAQTIVMTEHAALMGKDAIKRDQRENAADAEREAEEQNK